MASLARGLGVTGAAADAESPTLCGRMTLRDMVLISVRMSLPFFGALVTDDEMRAGGGAAVVVVTAASFSSSPISVTGTSLVSMILVDEMDELRNLLTMFFGDSFFPGLFPAPLPPFPFPLFELTFDGGVPV